MSGFEQLGKKLAQLGQDTKASVQKMSESYSLNSKIGEEKRALDQLFAQIGEAVFEKAGEIEIPGLEGLTEQFDAVKAAKETIASLEEQVQKLKGVATCPDCGKEAAKGEKYCSACGAKLPEVEEAADKVVESAKEVGAEVGDAVNEAADKAKDFFSNVADKAGAFFEGVTSRINAKEEDAAEAEADDLDDLEEAAEEVAEVLEEDAVEEVIEEAAEKVAQAEEAVEAQAEAAAEEAAQEAAENSAEA